MKIVIPGGSGQIGNLLARVLMRMGHEVVVLSRTGTSKLLRVASWDGETAGDWINEIEGSDVVINLSGKSVNCRYNQKNREEIVNSRTRSTRVIGEAIAGCKNPPRLWLQAGTATIYSHRFDAANDEKSGIIGGNESNAPFKWKFSTDVAKAWEKEIHEAKTPHTRKVIMRSAMTMSPDPGGIFDTLMSLVRMGLGGTAGNGKQYVSWIHEFDFIRAVEWLLENEDIEGPVNLASPNPLPQSQFMKILRKSAGVPVGLPSTKWMLEAGALLIRTETELLLKSRNVIPGILESRRFRFKMPFWVDAAPELVARWKRIGK